ncbi:MAG: hypothetical protein K0B07_05780 [DPANN group archaeon]|nr:hypothetical protein [DPANN group archaeon]
MPKNDKREVLECEVITSNSNGLKVVGAVGVVVVGASNAFALAATDFDVTTATADMGLAAIAVITLSVLALGYAFVKKVL